MTLVILTLPVILISRWEDLTEVKRLRSGAGIAARCA